MPQRNLTTATMTAADRKHAAAMADTLERMDANVQKLVAKKQLRDERQATIRKLTTGDPQYRRTLAALNRPDRLVHGARY